MNDIASCGVPRSGIELRWTGSRSARQVLSNGLYLLGIETLEQM